MSKPRRPVMVIFDRDGVLNVDHGYAFKPDELEWVPGARGAVRRVNEAGALAVIATNQSGIGRGYYAEADMEAFHAEMLAQLAAEGARIDGIYFAPHHEDAAEDRYRVADHPDRKPNPGMLLKALADFAVAPADAVMIGDKPSDMEAARRAGVRGVRYAGGDLEALVVRELATLTGTTVPK
ncbi:MAG: HAD family hydrolase [Caulobacterales bacterium]|nr:HAD family hydrolase [Caulobacterales bacterium]